MIHLNFSCLVFSFCHDLSAATLHGPWIHQVLQWQNHWCEWDIEHLSMESYIQFVSTFSQASAKMFWYTIVSLLIVPVLLHWWRTQCAGGSWGLYTCEIQSNLRLYDIGSTGGAAERQPCHLDCWILRQLVLRLPVLCSSLCKPLSEVSKIEWPGQQVRQTSSQDIGFSCNWKRHGKCHTQ